MDRDGLPREGLEGGTILLGESIQKSGLLNMIANLILQYKPGKGVEICNPIRGGHNVLYRLKYEDGTSACMRVPCEVSARFPEEKVGYEVAMMRYVAANTTIPVPKVYHHGTAAENPSGTGPFIIMDYVDHEKDMSDILNDPTLETGDLQIIDPNIAEEKLEKLYEQMANILLQLSRLSFSRIGSLIQDADGSFSLSGRPLTQYMNVLAGWMCSDFVPLSLGPYSTDKEWYCALADMHLMQLNHQRNGGIIDEDDARDKYVARHLFRELAYDGWLTLELVEEGSEPTFYIYSGDLRPTNVLIDKDFCVTGVIDWEFAHAAPKAFSSDPPWWLLLRKPEDWPGGYEAWMNAYQPRLELFLRVLENEESKLWGNSTTGSMPASSDTPLSQRMRKSWENRTWMINYAARNGCVFDHLYWKYLDSRFFGSSEKKGHRARLSLFTKKEIEAMEYFVKGKMKENVGWKYIDWDALNVPAQLDDSGL
ncbi:phosphotransferase family protein [Xylaria castorea]|nr:phosphotransferase family protein [Xylaria castorea]